MFALLVISVVVFVILYALFINKIRGLPPGPPPLPIIGNTLQFGDSLEKTLFKWREKYGPVYTVWLPQPTVFLTNYKTIYNTIVKQSDLFGSRPLDQEALKFILKGNWGLVFEEDWREQRRFALHSLRDLGFTASSTQDIVLNLTMEVIEKLKVDGANNTPLDVSDHLMYSIANVIWNFVFGRTLPYGDSLFGQVREYMAIVMNLVAHPSMILLETKPKLSFLDPICGGMIKRQYDTNEKLLDVLRNEIKISTAAFSEGVAASCYVDAFLGERKKNMDNHGSEGGYSDLQLLMACYDMWAAGFDTIVATLRFHILYIVNNPEVQKKMQREIDEKIGTSAIRMEDQKLLPYCCAVIQEVQRIGVLLPINLPRINAESINIEGHIIPKGTNIIPQYGMYQLDPDEFERPDYFCPERFINEEGQFVKDPRVTPFSVGKRSCLGEGLARLELFITITSFAQHLNFSSPSLIPPEIRDNGSFIRAPASFNVLVSARCD